MSGTIDKYEYLTSEEILASDYTIIIEQAKFIYSPLRKTFKKETKTIGDQVIKHSTSSENFKTREK